VRVVGLEHADDRTIWEFARAGGFAVVTLDSDFADLAALRGAPPKVVWLRCGNQSTAETARLLRDRAADIAAFLANEDAACLEVY
jgi:predicted nuclease of predicted toxin-antitoxin system